MEKRRPKKLGIKKSEEMPRGGSPTRGSERMYGEGYRVLEV